MPILTHAKPADPTISAMIERLLAEEDHLPIQFHSRLQAILPNATADGSTRLLATSYAQRQGALETLGRVVLRPAIVAAHCCRDKNTEKHHRERLFQNRLRPLPGIES